MTRSPATGRVTPARPVSIRPDTMARQRSSRALRALLVLRLAALALAFPLASLVGRA